MRLGNLIDPATKQSLRAMVGTPDPWHKRSDEDRMKAVNDHCTLHAAKLGQFLDKKVRVRCTETIPYGRGTLIHWIKTHASELAKTNSRLTPQKAMLRSMHDIATHYGYAKSLPYLSHSFAAFELR